MTEKMITITIRGAAAERLREAQEKPKRIDWTGFSQVLANERKQKRARPGRNPGQTQAVVHDMMTASIIPQDGGFFNEET